MTKERVVVRKGRLLKERTVAKEREVVKRGDPSNRPLL
jgi:hypothetical protein